MFAALIGGGIFGIYMLGFLVPLGDGRAILAGVIAATAYAIWRGGMLLEFWATPHGAWYYTDDYYTGLLCNLIAFVVGFLAAGVIQLFVCKKRDWTNLTVWTQDGEPLQ